MLGMDRVQHIEEEVSIYLTTFGKLGRQISHQLFVLGVVLIYGFDVYFSPLWNLNHPHIFQGNQLLLFSENLP